MHSSTFNFERNIPAHPWRKLTFAVLILTLLIAAGWESYVRSLGYRPSLNDTADLWSERREMVQPNSVVIIGDSRTLFDLDLNVLEQGLGTRPVQLGLVGSSAYPILENLTSDESFHGTILVGVVPALFFAPAGPPLEVSEKALKTYRNRTISQKISHHLAMSLEEQIAFLKQDDLTLGKLLEKIDLPNREGAQIPPRLPPYFSTLERDRGTKMVKACEEPGPLQTRVKEGWLPLFTPPPPPNWVPIDAFGKQMGQLIEERFAKTAAAIKRFRSRGGKVVFLRLPVSGKLKEIEDHATPRVGPWNRLLSETQAPGIYFEDYPELAHFECPEWSHLSSADSVEFTRNLVPHLRESLTLNQK